MENILYISRREFDRLKKLNLGVCVNSQGGEVMLLQGFFIIPQDYTQEDLNILEVSNGEQTIPN
jgi:hypothetical protein